MDRNMRPVGNTIRKRMEQLGIYSSSETFPVTQQQKENNEDKDLQSSIHSTPVLYSKPSYTEKSLQSISHRAQALRQLADTSKPTENSNTAKSFTELIQDRANCIRRRPIVAEKPRIPRPPVGKGIANPSSIKPPQLEHNNALPIPVKPNFSKTTIHLHQANINQAKIIQDRLKIMPDDLPRLPLQISRQRTSYAEPRKIVELKPSVSFNQCDYVKNAWMTEPNNYAKCMKQFEQLMTELIQTEEDNLKNLLECMQKYGNIFIRRDLPLGLRGKKFDLFGSIEQIVVFHRDTLLPMLLRNRNDLSRLFDEFSILIDDHHMYCYVMYAMNKKRSLKLLEDFSIYFKHLLMELGDKLGIESFLLQPIQRLIKYKQFFESFLKIPFGTAQNTAVYFKNEIKSCCCLQNKLCSLLDIVNEATCIADIDGWGEMNLCNPYNKFRKMLGLYVKDTDRSLNYASKVFMFDKFMIYTEIQGSVLKFRGYYDPCHTIELIPSSSYFTMSYRGMQHCEFREEPLYIQYCLKLIENMIISNAHAEPLSNQSENNQQLKLQTRYSNRYDSGLGNMWTLPEDTEFETALYT